METSSSHLLQCPISASRRDNGHSTWSWRPPTLRGADLEGRGVQGVRTAALLIRVPFLKRAASLTIDVINVFYVFYSGDVFLRFRTFFLFFPRSNAKYKYVKIQRKIFLEDDLAMIFIDFGLLRSLYCKISYLLAEEH